MLNTVHSTRCYLGLVWARSDTLTELSCVSTARSDIIVGQARRILTELQIVVPTQFVMFNLSAIVGSAILYGDFKRATFHQIVTFLYGCGATFAGVFVIAWAPNHTGEGDEGAKSAQAGNDVEAGTSATPSEALSPNVGSLSRRNRATLVIPEPIIGSNASSPVLRNRRSLVSLVGLSPAQVSETQSSFLLYLIRLGHSIRNDYSL